MSVLDASVVLKWFVNEEDSSQALNLRKEFYAGKREIVVPDLCFLKLQTHYDITQVFLQRKSGNLWTRYLA
jgi:predicted nucleic acid-binding protein